MKQALIAFALLLGLMTSASANGPMRFAADLPVPPPVTRPPSPPAARPSPPPVSQPSPAPAEPSILGYGDANKSCAQWTDGCRTCSRSASGDPVCPNIGPACQPKAITCLRQR